jgi:hypothetical protein
MDLNDLFNMLWGSDGKHPFGNPDGLRDYLGGQELEEETCEFVKGNIRTTITYQFNKQGFLVGHRVVSQSLAGNTDLQKQLDEALEKEDYETAARIKQLMDDQDQREGKEDTSEQP